MHLREFRVYKDGLQANKGENSSFGLLKRFEKFFVEVRVGILGFEE